MFETVGMVDRAELRKLIDDGQPDGRWHRAWRVGRRGRGAALGVLAAHELGVACERTALVPDPRREVGGGLVRTGRRDEDGRRPAHHAVDAEDAYPAADPGSPDRLCAADSGRLTRSRVQLSTSEPRWHGIWADGHGRLAGPPRPPSGYPTAAVGSLNLPLPAWSNAGSQAPGGATRFDSDSKTPATMDGSLPRTDRTVSSAAATTTMKPEQWHSCSRSSASTTI